LPDDRLQRASRETAQADTSQHLVDNAYERPGGVDTYSDGGVLSRLVQSFDERAIRWPSAELVFSSLFEPSPQGFEIDPEDEDAIE
jgi:hypothetical protein